MNTRNYGYGDMSSTFLCVVPFASPFILSMWESGHESSRKPSKAELQLRCHVSVHPSLALLKIRQRLLSWVKDGWSEASALVAPFVPRSAADGRSPKPI